jgi:ABC-type multidrug transport system ATPase subunit
MVGLEVRNLGLKLRGESLLSITHFDCLPGELVCVLGPNGCGKSLFLESLCGNYVFTGDAQFYNEPAGHLGKTHVPMDRVRIAALVQRMNLWPRARVGELLTLAERIEGRTRPWPEALCRIKNRAYKNLSTGERQLLYFAFIQDLQVDVLILDEPTMGLDAENDEFVIDTIVNTKASRIVAIHSFRDVLRLADRCYFMCRGDVIPLSISLTDKLERMAVLEAIVPHDVPTNKNQYGFSYQIEVTSEDHVNRVARQLIMLGKELGNHRSNVRLELKVPRGVYEEYSPIPA